MPLFFCPFASPFEKFPITQENLVLDNFLVNKGETAIEKYGDILNKIIELTK